MDELVNKSLLKTSCSSDTTTEGSGSYPGSFPGSFSGSSPGYAIHNLQLNYLLENCENIEERHKRLVECYKKACKGTFVCPFVCLSVCLFICLFICLFVCSLACVFARLFSVLAKSCGYH